jgi:hypothetical protein
MGIAVEGVADSRSKRTNMFRRLIMISAIAAGALALIRLNAQRARQRATDAAARDNWEGEGGASAAPKGSAAPGA